MSAVAIKALMGTPFPSALAMVMMSGVTP